MSPVKIIDMLQHRRFSLGNETLLQQEINDFFTVMNVEFKRHLYLDDKNIIDFFFYPGIGMEVKIKGSKREIYRQCERYCTFDQVKILMLVTSISMKLPREINKKPCFVFNLSKAWM